MANHPPPHTLLINIGGFSFSFLHVKDNDLLFMYTYTPKEPHMRTKICLRKEEEQLVSSENQLKMFFVIRKTAGIDHFQQTKQGVMVNNQVFVCSMAFHKPMS